MIEARTLMSRVLILGVVCLLASSCRSWRGSCDDPVPYQAAQTGASLKIPPNLQAPDTTNALKIPELNTPKPPPRQKKDGCLDAPPPFATPKPTPPPAA